MAADERAGIPEGLEGCDERADVWARANLPSYGPDWDRAIAYGVDVVLLLENLALTPAQRLDRLQQTVDFHELLRAAGDAGK